MTTRPPQRVTESLGYSPDGGGIDVQRDHAMRIRRYALERDAWECGRRDDIAIEGLDGCLDMFGLDPLGDLTTPDAGGPSAGGAA